MKEALLLQAQYNQFANTNMIAIFKKLQKNYFIGIVDYIMAV